MLRPKYAWKLRSCTLPLGERTLVMGILNVTSDSFSDGGRFLDHDRAVEHALRMLDEGADILDIGGESTRPGKKEPVTGTEEELRILPVIQAVLNKRPKTLFSVDTYRASTARAAVEAGAEIVNDVSAGRWDKRMAHTVAELRCGAILMHMRGRPEEWRTLPPLPDPTDIVKSGLRDAGEGMIRAGVKEPAIVLDPGFGFGKNFGENFPLLARMDELHELGFPILSGTSRKSFIGRALATEHGDAASDARLFGTIATVTASVLKGAHIVRVHDVKAAVDACRVADALVTAASEPG